MDPHAILPMLLQILILVLKPFKHPENHSRVPRIEEQASSDTNIDMEALRRRLQDVQWELSHAISHHAEMDRERKARAEELDNFQNEYTHLKSIPSGLISRAQSRRKDELYEIIRSRHRRYEELVRRKDAEASTRRKLRDEELDLIQQIEFMERRRAREDEERYHLRDDRYDSRDEYRSHDRDQSRRHHREERHERPEYESRSSSYRSHNSRQERPGYDSRSSSYKSHTSRRQERPEYSSRSRTHSSRAQRPEYTSRSSSSRSHPAHTSPPRNTFASAETIAQWRSFVDKSFDDYSKMTAFPYPPSKSCGDTECESSRTTRLTAACPCNLKDLFKTVQDLDLKKERLRWHPDRFRSCPEEHREEFGKIAQEIFVVLDAWYKDEKNKGGMK